MPHVLLKCDDPGSRRTAAASARFDVLLFRALMGDDSAAVSRCALTQFRTVIYAGMLASSFMYERLCVCDALVCVQMFVVESLRDEKLSPHFVLFKEMRGRDAPRPKSS